MSVAKAASGCDCRDIQLKGMVFSVSPEAVMHSVLFSFGLIEEVSDQIGFFDRQSKGGKQL